MRFAPSAVTPANKTESTDCQALWPRRESWPSSGASVIVEISAPWRSRSCLLRCQTTLLS
jgi:hypothetical protein